jgi:hypothetical protein
MSMPPMEFEPTIPEGERPQTYALDRAASGTGRPAGSPVKLTETLPCSSTVIRYNCQDVSKLGP